ncbi:MAG: S8 family serine peptidase [Vicinamibacterales bacterium]
MRRRVSRLPAAALLVLVCAGTASAASSVDARLLAEAAAAPLARIPVVITFHRAPTIADLAALRALGIGGGIVLRELPMVLTGATAAQLNVLRDRPEIRSLYANRQLKPLTNASRRFIGLESLAADADVRSLRAGLPVSGAGIGIAYIDTGVDATHADLRLGGAVVQNVAFPLSQTLLNFNDEFAPPIALEDQATTDHQGGHGTFGAAVTAGSGQASGGFYGGVAPGSGIIGLQAGNDVGLSFFAILQAYDYALTNQFRYNIRVANNSFGTTLADLPYDPDDPIQVATRELHDRFITVVVAAGNDGNVPNAINPISVAPWVISVAAGSKDGFGSPAAFSSRGVDNGMGSDVAGQPADPTVAPNLRPDITAPGVDVKAARAKTAGLTNLAGTPWDASTIAPAFLPFYTTSSGTSFATPHVTGVVALMLEVNPALSPDEVVTLLRQTATPMPFDERVVGAGYVDAHNAVRAAMGLAPVPHPRDLSAPDGIIVDAEGDQLGSTAHDIRAGTFSYDSAAQALVYRLRVEDLSVRRPADRWTISSDFGSVTVFVSASVTETGALRFTYGRIAPDPSTGVNTQTNLGAPDAGAIEGNDIEIRLSLARLNAAVGTDVLFSRSTRTQAVSQVLVGSSLTGGLLLAADTSSGSDFAVGEPAPPPPPPPPPEERPFTERFSGTLPPGQDHVDVPIAVRRDSLDAKLTWHPGTEDVTLALVDAGGRVVVEGVDARRIEAAGLAPGDYALRVRGAVSRSIDFVIKVTQGLKGDR